MMLIVTLAVFVEALVAHKPLVNGILSGDAVTVVPAGAEILYFRGRVFVVADTALVCNTSEMFV